MVDAIGNVANGSINECKLNATRMVASKASHNWPTDGSIGRACPVNTEAGTFPVEIKLQASRRPIAVAHECRTVLVSGRRLSDQQCLARPVCNLTQFDASIEVRVSPKHSESLDGIVTARFWMRRRTAPESWWAVKWRPVITGFKRRIACVAFVTCGCNSPKRIGDLNPIGVWILIIARPSLLVRRTYQHFRLCGYGGTKIWLIQIEPRFLHLPDAVQTDAKSIE